MKLSGIVRCAVFVTTVAVWCVLSPQIGRAADDPAKLVDGFRKALARTPDAAYSVALQRKSGGKEAIEAKWARGGALYLKWTGGPYVGRELLYKPGWNGGQTWIKESGPLGFSAASVPLDAGYVQNDYLLPLRAAALDKLADEIAAWVQAGDAQDGDEPNGLVVARPDRGKLTAVFGGDGFPKRVTFADADGRRRETYELTNLRPNTKLTERDFDVANPAYGFPGYAAGGLYIDPQGMKRVLGKAWAAVRDYRCTLKKRERIDGKLQDLQTVALKYRKPGDMYMKWQKGSHQGREMLYRAGAETLLAREAGLLGLAAVSLKLDSALVKRDTNHRLSDLDIGYTLNIMYDTLTRGLTSGQTRIRFKGVGPVGGRRAYTVENWNADPKANRYYCAHSVVSHDFVTGLPIRIVNYDERDQLFEEFEWANIEFNVGLTDADFDAANPQYRLK